MDEAVLVDARGGARPVEKLQMKYNSKEIPDLLSDAEPDDWRLVAEYAFGASAGLGGEACKENSRLDALQR